MAMQQVPDDILHLICQELYHRQDLSSLFSCATTCSRHLSPLALAALYRTHGQAPRDDEEAEGLNSAAQQELFVQKWMIMWRSILHSTQDKTVFPYHQYIRHLDLRDLRHLLEDTKFRGAISDKFFGGDLKKFHFELAFNRTTPRGKPIKQMRLDVNRIIEAIGDAITAKQPRVEVLSGEFSSQALLRWTPQLQWLQKLELWDGSSLGDSKVQNALYSSCPYFHHLSIYKWIDPSSDRLLGEFLYGLASNTLRTFTTYSNVGASTETCKGLSRHGESLAELTLNLPRDELPALVHLKECTSLETLSIASEPVVDIKATEHDVFLEVVSWLKGCSRLRDIKFHLFLAGASVLEPILQSEKVSLLELNLNSYSMREHRSFHKALAKQTSLRSLFLAGDAEAVTRDDNETLCETVCNLGNLRHLELVGLSEYLSEEANMAILTSLPELEVVYMVGIQTTDATLEVIASHANLRSVILAGISRLTLNGLLDFVNKVDSARTNLELLVHCADPTDLLSDEEVAIVKQRFWEKVEGRFEYYPWRDPNVSEFEASDSD